MPVAGIGKEYITDQHRVIKKGKPRGHSMGTPMDMRAHIANRLDRFPSSRQRATGGPVTRGMYHARTERRTNSSTHP